MYADDTQLYMKITSPEEIKTMNQELKETVEWFVDNHLKLNAQKTEFLLISPPKSSAKIKEWTKMITTLNGTPTIVDSSKSLGIILDKDLNMRAHINTMTKNARFHLNYLRKLKPLIDPGDLKTAVQALVISRLEYGCAYLSGLPKISTAPLKACLNAATRLITESKKYDHITPHLKALNWLPYEARIELKIACITQKAIHHKTPHYLAHKISLSVGSRTSRGSEDFLLKPAFFRKKKKHTIEHSRELHQESPMPCNLKRKLSPF